MSCSTDRRVPPAEDLQIISHVNEPLLANEVNNVADALKAAGVAKINIENSGTDNNINDDINIRPVGGNVDQVRQILETIKGDLAKIGIVSVERPLLRCPNTPWYLRVIKQPTAR